MRATVQELLAANPSDDEAIIAWLSDAAVPELEEFILDASRKYGFQGERPMRFAQLTLQSRLAEPHWSVTPNFWITLISAVAAILAAYAAVRVELRELARDRTSRAVPLTPLQAPPPSPAPPSNAPAVKP